MLGLTFDKILVIAVIAALILGPKRLPAAAAALGRMVRTLRQLATDTTGRIREEVGPEFDDINWTTLDPRHYDPRRIIREALTTEPTMNEPAPNEPTPNEPTPTEPTTTEPPTADPSAETTANDDHETEHTNRPVQPVHVDIETPLASTNPSPIA